MILAKRLIIPIPEITRKPTKVTTYLLSDPQNDAKTYHQATASLKTFLKPRYRNTLPKMWVITTLVSCLLAEKAGCEK